MARLLKAVALWCGAMVACGAGLVACAANPGPPPLVEQQPLQPAATETSDAVPVPARTQVSVGVDGLRNGLNPHLVADESAVVQNIADLVLPSAFEHGQRNEALLRGATVLANSPGAMTVRYIISDAAQWSDGVPVTGADFAYLWRGMSTTAGVVNPAGYRAISTIRVSGATGKVVDVDFAEEVQDWRSLFDHLLPSHLFAQDASDFSYALRDTIPAAAQRFMVKSVDRGRGTIVLHRNDRFWGEAPAKIDILTLVAVRNTTQIADQLRAGQLGYVDKTPEETTGRVFALLPAENTQFRFIDGPRTLGLHLSATSGLSQATRQELRQLIDVALLATIAAGRTADVNVAEHEPVLEGEPLAVRNHVAAKGQLRIGADPTDPAASAAARSLVDMLAARGVQGRVVATDINNLITGGLEQNTIDVLIAWQRDIATTADAASRIACQVEAPRAGNLSGFCSPASSVLAEEMLAGMYPLEQARERVRALLYEQALWVPLMHERRIVALGQGIVGPYPELAQWQAGLSTAGFWQLVPPKSEAATTTTQVKKGNGNDNATRATNAGP